MQGRAHKRSGRGSRRGPGWGRLLSCSMKITSVVRKLWNYITEFSRESLRYSSEPQHTEALNIIQLSDVSIGDHFSFSGVWSVHPGEYRDINVVIKMLRKDSALEISAVGLKQQSELTVLSNLRHPRILPLLGVILDLDEAIAGFVTEFMPRGSLYDVLHLDTTPPEHRLTTLSSRLLVLRDVADGMRFLHEKKIIHHDLKSPSVLLDENGRAKLCDFGMSHIFYPNISRTAAFVGSPAWSSPEFLNGKVSTADQSTDVYSFGVIMWETLTNNIPWDGSGTDSFQNASRISRGASLPLDAIPSCVPSELSAMLRQCMAHDPDGRPTFNDIIQRLSDVPPACVEREGSTYYPHVCDVSDKKVNIIRFCDVKIKNRITSAVCRGEYRGTNVAIKLLREGSAMQTSADAAQYLEIEILSRLRHPRILCLIGVIMDLETYCGAVAGLVTEFMHRGSLYDVLHRDTTPPEHRLTTLSSKVCVLRDVADGMHFLHMSNVIHRDLKSPNVLLDENGRAKICDFGLSHIFVSPNVSYATAVVGTPAWSSPEALVNDANTVHQATDVYSFGVILWEVLTNNIPWNGLLASKIIIRMSQGTSLPLDAVTSIADTPPALVVMLEQCLASNPEHRPTFEHIAQCLSDVLPACIEREGRVPCPDDYLCSISHEIMEDPVICSDGHTYDRVHIEQWLQHNDTSPLTNAILADNTLRPNIALRRMIQAWRESSTPRRITVT